MDQSSCGAQGAELAASGQWALSINPQEMSWAELTKHRWRGVPTCWKQQGPHIRLGFVDLCWCDCEPSFSCKRQGLSLLLRWWRWTHCITDTTYICSSTIVICNTVNQKYTVDAYDEILYFRQHDTTLFSVNLLLKWPLIKIQYIEWRWAKLFIYITRHEVSQKYVFNTFCINLWCHVSSAS